MPVGDNQGLLLTEQVNRLLNLRPDAIAVNHSLKKIAILEHCRPYDGIDQDQDRPVAPPQCQIAVSEMQTIKWRLMDSCHPDDTSGRQLRIKNPAVMRGCNLRRGRNVAAEAVV